MHNWRETTQVFNKLMFPKKLDHLITIQESKRISLSTQRSWYWPWPFPKSVIIRLNFFNGTLIFDYINGNIENYDVQMCILPVGPTFEKSLKINILDIISKVIPKWSFMKLNCFFKQSLIIKFQLIINDRPTTGISNC